MKLNKLSVACALACATFAGQSLALTPAQLSGSTEVFISGASAQQLTLGHISNNLFPVASEHVYFNDVGVIGTFEPGTDGRNYRAYTGTLSAALSPALPAGTKVVILNRAKGGSVWGVNPVANAEKIESMVLDTSCVLSTSAAALAVHANGVYLCPNVIGSDTTTADPAGSRIPDAGVSDVEPALFVGINLATGQTPLPAVTAGPTGGLDDLTVSSQNAVIFGIAATNNVTLPSLSRAQVTSMLTGSYLSWNQVDPALPAQGVTVCRRVQGSGSQAAANAFFTQYPCSSGRLVPTTNANNDPVSGYTVVMNSTAGDVATCLNTAQAAGKRAIGILATERQPSGTDGWHYASIDGVNPVGANPNLEVTATKGQYDWSVEQSMQWLNSVSGAKLDLLTKIRDLSGDPAFLATLPGVASLPTIADPNADYTANPGVGYQEGAVMAGSRFSNTCQPTQLFNQ